MDLFEISTEINHEENAKAGISLKIYYNICRSQHEVSKCPFPSTGIILFPNFYKKSWILSPLLKIFFQKNNKTDFNENEC